VVDVTVVMDEDKRYYVGKITFTGNTTTRDKVIRREVYLNEGDVFNTEALKLSIRRINQLGYFKPLETAPQLSPSAQGEDKLDVTLKVEEQNRNQFSLGGGVSGLEGTFVNAGFQTANFLGMGETLQLTAQAGGRTNNYQLALTEPYLFDRPISAGFDVYSRKIDYLASDGTLGYSEVRIGGSVTAGLPLRRFTRLFTNYTYEVIETAVRDDLSAAGGSASPLTLATDGRNQESRVSPALVHDTVDSPYTPRSGRRVTGTVTVAGGPLGGTTDYWKPSLEAIVYVPHTRRTAVGFRGQVGWVGRYADTRELPYYQRYFLGGETQIRGVNVRTVSALDESKRAVGGNKFLLFNAEYYVDLVGPLRFLLFFDAGEAYSEGQGFNLRTLRTSTGAEMRFLMPVLNVPFRLIYAYNANRDSFQPRTAFKFAVGTTF
jgi:outer membrane protein insertion porin family